MGHQNTQEGYAGTKRRSSSLELEELSDSDPQKIVQTTKSKGIVNVQLFIRKAFAMINESDATIAEWTPEGDKFVVKNKEVFASKVIPQYYDHNNYSSFTRQLNFYGFTREQSMTIKVSDLSSLAVGQETFYHPDFMRNRPDLLKNLQRRSTGDTKNGKKRKKPRTTDDVTLAALQNKMESMEQQTADLLSSMNVLREENYTSAAAIRDLQTRNVAKDAKIDSLEKRLGWLERRGSANPIHQQESFVPQGQRLDASAGVNSGGVSFPGDSAPSSATLAPHPRMKKIHGTQRDMFSFDNTNVATVPSRETSLDLGLFTGLTRDSSLMSWLPRQDMENSK